MKRLALVSSILLVALQASAAWLSEPVITTDDVGSGCSLAADRWGRLHVAFYDKTNGAVKYGRRVSGTWTFETVAEGVDVTGTVALCLDAFDTPHIAFCDAKVPEVDYATKSGSTWTKEKVEGITSSYVAIAAWPAGPRIAYSYTSSSFDTRSKYAVKSGGSWTTENIVSSGDGGMYIGLAVDAAGVSHAYYLSRESGKKNIKHATRGETSWTAEVIGEGTDCGIAEGPDGKTHVSYAAASGEGVVYAYPSSTTWTTEPITTATGQPLNTHICLDGAGGIFISYFDLSKTDLKIVYKTGNDWELDTVATGGYVGFHHSLALGPNGFPYVLYYDGDKGDLMLARYDTTTDVKVTGFKASRKADEVAVSWACFSPNVAGFNLYRGAADGARAKVNDALITGVSPFRYADAAAPAAATSYWLEAVPLSGPATTLGPAVAPPAHNAVAFELYQNTPNPARGETTFNFTLANAGWAKIAIYDLAGRLVATVAEGNWEAGRHAVKWSGSLTPGLYIYKLDAAGASATRKMLVVQ